MYVGTYVCTYVCTMNGWSTVYCASPIQLKFYTEYYIHVSCSDIACHIHTYIRTYKYVSQTIWILLLTSFWLRLSCFVHLMQTVTAEYFIHTYVHSYVFHWRVQILAVSQVFGFWHTNLHHLKV